MCIRFLNKKPKLQEKSVTITENGTTNITPDTGNDGLSSVSVTTNVSGGADLSEYFASSIGTGNSSINGLIRIIKTIPDNISINGTSLAYSFYNCIGLTTIPLLNTSNVINMNYMFASCSELTSIALLDTSKVTNMSSMFRDCKKMLSVPQLNTSSVTDMSSMFYNCIALTAIPQLDTSSVTNMRYMVSFCSSLTNDSLNNILAMCANATSYTGTKTLAYLGLTSTQATTCQGLSNYQAFLDAGWTTGY